MFKTMLTHVRVSPDSEALLQAAVAFAQAQGASLIGIGGREPFLPTSDYVTAEVMQMIADQEAADLAAAKLQFDQATAEMAERAHWRVVRDRANTALANEAAAADVVITAIGRKGRPCHVDCSSLVMEVGLPVLALPAGLSKIGLGNIVVAWRNTAEARRAISLALPLLKAATQVTLVQIAARDDVDLARVGAHAAVSRLAAHGVHANAEIDVGHDAVGMLADKAGRLGADMIVLGGYGHSRAREWVMGGVTADLIASSPLPLLLAH